MQFFFGRRCGPYRREDRAVDDGLEGQWRLGRQSWEVMRTWTQGLENPKGTGVETAVPGPGGGRGTPCDAYEAGCDPLGLIRFQRLAGCAWRHVWKVRREEVGPKGHRGEVAVSASRGGSGTCDLASLRLSRLQNGSL